LSIGIIGSGELGSSLARAFAAAGVAATIANKRGPASLATLIDELGPSITAGTVEEAAAADIVVVAVRWVDTPTAVRNLPPWEGRIVIDATNALEFLEPGSPETTDPSNPLAAFGIKPVDLAGKLSTEIFSALVPGARAVKAFNHLNVEMYAQPATTTGRRVLFYAGDDDAARSEVRGLIEALGFFPVDLGSLKVGGSLIQAPTGSLASVTFTAT
jgi:predicted dinucleotide-binding enzyme